MDPILIVSGLLAALGAGAGGLAWYRKNYGTTPAEKHDQAVAAAGNPYTGPLVPAAYATPAAAHDAKVAASGNPYAGPFVSATKTPVAATPSPYIAPGPSTVAPAPTKGPTVSITLPFGLGGISGNEAHI